jgi:hypothetical protein
MGKQTGKIDVLVTLPVVIIRLGGGDKKWAETRPPPTKRTLGSRRIWSLRCNAADPETGGQGNYICRHNLGMAKPVYVDRDIVYQPKDRYTGSDVINLPFPGRRRPSPLDQR